jgi:PAS domain S-box-containing protein
MKHDRRHHILWIANPPCQRFQHIIGTYFPIRQKGVFMAPLGHDIELADILDASTNGVLVADKKGVIVYMNKLVSSYFRLAGDTGIGLPVGDLIPQMEGDVADCIRSGEAIIGRQLKEKKTSVVANISPIVKQGEVVGASMSFKNMDEYEQLAEKLDSYKNQNKLLDAVFNASSDGLWIIDPNGVVVAWNPAAEFITGFKAEEIVGERFTDLEDVGIPKEDVRYIEEAIETKRRISTFNVHPRSNKQVLGNATPVLDDDGKVLWIVGNENDLSELNALKEELKNALKVTEKAKDELTGLNLSELRAQEIVAESKGMLQVLHVAAKLAKVGASHILITGESGTGKGFLAKFIHKKSAHASQPFVQINCAAVPENLLEAELFGYEKGAFTGAGDKGKAGLIELAHGGTLFLDEIGDMPMRLQVKLLKYLDDHEVMRLGSVKARKIDCVIVSATNQNLDELAEQKRFRQDLFFRLNNFQIHIPPLRERTEDIFELVQFYIHKYNKEYKRRKRVSAQGIETMQSYPFPGNVRELKSICKQAVLMSEETLLDRYFAENLQMVCAPAGFSESDPPVRSNSAQASVPSGKDPATWIAAWIAKNLTPLQAEGGANTGSNAQAAHPLLAQVIQKAIELGRIIYAETCRQLSDAPPAGLPPQPPAPAPADHGSNVEKVTNLRGALEAHEREIFLQAREHCNTIRELAEHLQTSPATALRKLKKHGLSL